MIRHYNSKLVNVVYALHIFAKLMDWTVSSQADFFCCRPLKQSEFICQDTVRN